MTPPPPTFSSTAPTANNIGRDGVKQIYPTKKGESEFYLTDNPDKNRFNISFGHGSHLPYTKKTENGLTYFNTTGSPITYHSGAPPGRSVRLDVYPDGGIWSNHTNYSWENNPGFLYTGKGIASGELTVYVRPHQALGTHQSLAMKLNGRDEDDKRSIFEICAADENTHKDPYAHWDYLHFPYVECPVKLVGSHGKMTSEKWYGLKSVHIVAADVKSSMFYLYEDIDPFDSNRKPKNNWKLIATAEDRGCKEYNNIPCTWRCHKDLIRIDGFQSVDFTLISDRSIDTTTAKPSV